MEKDLIDSFKSFLMKTFNMVDVYHVYSSSYGEQGQPDLIVSSLDFSKSIFVEVKEAYSFEEAVSKLRRTQRGRIKKLYMSGVKVILLYNTGAALFDNEWVEHSDSSPFNGFVDILKREKIV